MTARLHNTDSLDRTTSDALRSLDPAAHVDPQVVASPRAHDALARILATDSAGPAVAPPELSRNDGDVSTRQVLLAALATLPARQRVVVVLRHFHDYTEAATAEAMGTSVGTVKSQTFKALAALRISGELREGAAPDLTGSAREGMTR